MFCATDYGFDFESFFGPRRRGRRRNMKWKIFERGDLKFVILRLISKQPMHGYEVMKALEEESKGYYRPSPGSVYPTLQMLDDEGYLTVEEKDGKKIYTITDEGMAYLGDNEDVVDDVFDRVENFTDRFFGGDMRALSRSFSKLAQLTFDQAFQWGAEPEDLARMNEILETAVGDMRATRKAARERRRSQRGERGARRGGGSRSRRGGKAEKGGEAEPAEED
ncbi:MAG: helix-turn-helix transcriptional regulator [Gemmatimonadetes bacterium]|nr:helix-turn-helix transcriptional regulator [Gemmatimonadota bacterium]